MMAEIMFATSPCVIAVCMRNHRTIYRAPGVDIEITCGTVKAFIRKINQCHQLADLAFWLLHLSLQYFTDSQFFAQLLRQVMGLPQVTQSFCGKDCLLPLKPDCFMA
jgi:hypothetical protein